MDDFALDFELELLTQMDEKQEKAGKEEEKAKTSPYRSAAQEGMGQLAAMFQDVDALWQALEEEGWQPNEAAEEKAETQEG